jgi:hypothetical protein
MPFRPAFFAFPNEPTEIRSPILAAVEFVKNNPDVSVTAWPHLPIFGADNNDPWAKVEIPARRH